MDWIVQIYNPSSGFVIPSALHLFFHHHWQLTALSIREANQRTDTRFMQNCHASLSYYLTRHGYFGVVTWPSGCTTKIWTTGYFSIVAARETFIELCNCCVLFFFSNAQIKERMIFIVKTNFKYFLCKSLFYIYLNLEIYTYTLPLKNLLISFINFLFIFIFLIPHLFHSP